MAQPIPTGFMLLQQHNALPCRCTEEQFQPFIKGVEAVLQQWTALLLVTAHRDEGASQIIRDEVLNWFWEEGEVFSDQLETYFEDFFESARYVAVEDGSTKEVADVLHDMFVRCAKSDYSSVEHYIATLPVFQAASPVQKSVFAGNWASTAEGQQVNVAGDNEDESDEDDEDEDTGVAPTGGDNEEELEVQQKPVQQAKPKPQSNKKNPFKKGNDGWCTVQRK